MNDKPDIIQIKIALTKQGIYAGFTKSVALTSKLLILMLVTWAIFFPEEASAVLNEINHVILSHFSFWYIYVMAFFVLVCLVLATIPKIGRLRLGADTDKPEFSDFSWFSMMFSAGIGVGMLTWAVTEPIYHLSNNPDVIVGAASSGDADNASNAEKWAFLHWGFSAWSSYAICGLVLAYFAFRKGQPLTIRSGLVPLFGRTLEGPFGSAIDIAAVVATVFGVAQTLSFGIAEWLDGLARVGAGSWMLTDQGAASITGIIFAVALITTIGVASAISGVDAGIKWLSTATLALSIGLLGVFATFGATLFGLESLTFTFLNYLQELPSMALTVRAPDGEPASVATQLSEWQSSWTVFYWAWWVAFAPFVGMFFARISKGRTIREFVLGTILLPSVMCFIWFAFAGGTALELELLGEAHGAISEAPDGDKIFVLTEILFAPISHKLGYVIELLIVILLFSYMVTLTHSAIFVVNTINAGGGVGVHINPHILFWGFAIAAVVSSLLIAGGLDAVRTAMTISALPFSIILALACGALGLSIYRDVRNDDRMASTI